MADDSEGGGLGEGEPNVGEEGPQYFPANLGPSIAHYYGDYVRQIFIITGAAMLILAPFLINRAPALLPFEIGGAIVLVILAALTNPHKVWVLMADVLAAGVGIIIFESLAIAAYASDNWFAFIAMEAVTLAFLFALYFALKTTRSMMFGTIGQDTSFK